MDAHNVIRVSDFGLSEDMYAKNYFRQDKNAAVKLPIKWMAPESLNDGIFTEKSDVVCSSLSIPPPLPLPPLFSLSLYLSSHGMCALLTCPHLQWSYGVTCWEVFSTGKTPYPGINPISLVRILEEGERLEKPTNAACPDFV